MENASKALIIAGAILIAILLISVGIMVMNSMNKPLDQASQEADAQAVQIFNAKFSPYMGKDKTVQTLKSVYSLAQSQGIAVFYKDEPHSTGSSGVHALTDIATYAESGKKYDINALNGDDGKITKIYVYKQEEQQ